MYIAEDIGSYKPDARNFEYLITHLKEQGFGKEHLLHVAQSLFHDHVPAKALGLRSEHDFAMISSTAADDVEQLQVGSANTARIASATSRARSCCCTSRCSAARSRTA
jgi:FMN phosphatase YigB (HAD superfamily)